jgi:hypothetical protein
MVSLILFIIASILNSIMDTLFDHFGVSIFKKLNPNFWNPMISWKNSKKILGYPIDAWHLVKSLFIICIIGAIIFYQPLISSSLILNILIFGISWNIIFDIFYNIILIL